MLEHGKSWKDNPFDKLWEVEWVCHVTAAASMKSCRKMVTTSTKRDDLRKMWEVGWSKWVWPVIEAAATTFYEKNDLEKLWEDARDQTEMSSTHCIGENSYQRSARRCSNDVQQNHYATCCWPMERGRALAEEP